MNLFTELKRRNVFRVGLFYVVSAWLVVQVAETLLPIFDVPDNVLRGIVLALVLGFIPALVFAWAFEMTPDGLKREKDVQIDPATKQQTAQKLNWATLIIAVLAIGLLVGDRLMPEPEDSYDAAASERSVLADATEVADDSPAEKSIAVLPFSDFSPGGDSQWFADGLSEEILNSLVRVPDLLVSARTSSFSFRDSSLPIPEIAAALGVAHVLEGSVRMGGDRVRVTAQLIRADDGFHVWSDTFDRETADMIGIQEDLARQIAEAMKTTMDPAALAEMAQVGTRSVEAYKAFIRGRATEDFGGNPDAYALFEQARRIDPGFSAAHFRAARFWQIQFDIARTDRRATDLSGADIRDQYQQRITAAIDTAEDPVDAMLYRATRARYELRLGEAIARFEDYVSKRPGDADAWVELTNLGGITGNDALHQRSMDFLAKRAETDVTAATYFANESFRSSNSEVATSRALSFLDRWPDSPELLYQVHRALLWAGRIDEAGVILERLFALDVDPPNPTLLRLRQACAEGRIADALEPLKWEPSEDRGARWLAWHLLSRPDRAYAELEPLERESNMHALVSFVGYPYFDARRYPSLMRLLEREGIDPPAPITIPFACPRIEDDA